MATTYRYLFANLLTNEIIAELPLTGVSFTQQLNQAKTNMAMENQDFIDNLPRDNKEELDKIKAELIQIPEFQDCIDLYNRLLELA